ncbi:uncharacterized protein TNIN_347091 [Trichonephila inaurata madagascariensis]|uniref:Uncharacterized protein n=1 Tax=Trichonephila inaurata madagascariensis TaxID=2747483 RepID=A0A8X6MFF9_9ARAC|nr:uncharacterized protein TNIN_347091 [Trichonephila inaurata madagascariensis]
MESSEPWQVKRAGLRTFTKTANVLNAKLVNMEFSVDLVCDKFTKLQSVYLDIKILDEKILDLCWLRIGTSESNIANEIEDREVYSDDFITLSRQVGERLRISDESGVRIKSNQDPEDKWPRLEIKPDEILVLSERRKRINLNVGLRVTAGIDGVKRYEKFSQFSKMTRILGWVKRFTKNCQQKVVNQEPFLSVDEVQDARGTLLLLIQSEFPGNRRFYKWSLDRAKSEWPEKSEN